MVHRTRNEVQTSSCCLNTRETTSLRFFRRWRRSATCTARGATILTASAYSPLRPAHHLDPRMLHKPSGEGVRATVRQNIHRYVSFKIHQYCPVAGPATEDEVVHAQNPGRLAIRRPHRADVVQQRVPGDHDTEIFQKARAHFFAEGEGDVQEPTIEPLGSSPVACGHTGQTFREDYPVAVPFVAEEPSNVQTNGNGDSLPGQISQRPCVPGVDPSGSLAARRATSCTGRGFRKEDDDVYVGTDPDEI